MRKGDFKVRNLDWPRLCGFGQFQSHRVRKGDFKEVWTAEDVEKAVLFQSHRVRKGDFKELLLVGVVRGSASFNLIE